MRFNIYLGLVVLFLVGDFHRKSPVLCYGWIGGESFRLHQRAHFNGVLDNSNASPVCRRMAASRDDSANYEKVFVR